LEYTTGRAASFVGVKAFVVMHVSPTFHVGVVLFDGDNPVTTHAESVDDGLWRKVLYCTKVWYIK